MSNVNRGRKRRRQSVYRPLIVTALAFSGSLSLINAVLAEGTTAGQTISNTATATYTDPTDAILTTESNTVEVTVAEVAGITVTNTDIRNTLEPDGTTPGDGEFEPGDTVVFEFEVRNVGNDATTISLTDAVISAGPIEDIASVTYSYDSNGDGDFDDPGDVNGQVITGRLETVSIPVDGFVVVDVEVEVDNNALLGDDISITLGDTPGNGQNQPFDASADSVFTVDNTTAVPGEADPANGPTNGEREASDTGSIELGGVPTPQQPLVTILKSVTSVTDPSNTPTDVSDDVVTYDFVVDMQETPPAGSDVIASDLEPIAINLNGRVGQDHYVFVSDAIPVNTELFAAPTAPANWQVIYSTTAIGAADALDAAWTTTQPALNTVTRIGFIYNPGNTSTAAAGDGATLLRTAPNVNFTGIQVVNTAANTANEIANIAQVYGAEEPDDPNTPEDESLNHPVIDESGDTTPSNYDETTGTYGGVDPENPGTGGTPPPGFDPDDGQVDDPTTLTPGDIDGGGATPGDPNDDHTGDPNDGPGEPVLVELDPPPASAILNGPEGEPGAVGPNSNEDDFTNKSTLGGPGVDPDPVGFTNTVENGSTVEGDIQLVLDPASTNPADDTYLPPGTEVEITLLDTTVYRFTLQPDGTWTPDGTNPTPFPILNNVPAGGEQNYSVDVDLPNNSTEDLEDYPVVINAQLDVDDNGTFDDGENRTIDRIYTGFLELEKTATIVQGDGPPVTGNTPAPGNQIVYDINYTNISETQTGAMTGNILLTASNLQILEDGTQAICDPDPTGANASGLNNWAIDNLNEDGDGFFTTGIDTSHVIGSVDVVSGLDAGSTGNAEFYNGVATCTGTTPDPFNFNATADIPETSGSSTTTDITRYLFEVIGDIEPGETGFVEFRRRVN